MSEDLAAKLPDVPPEAFPQQLVATYPRIIERIVELWGRADEIEAYFQTLMLDHRGSRQGFPEEVLTEIVKLRSYYRSRLPLPPRTVDNWADFLGREAEEEAQRPTPEQS